MQATKPNILLIHNDQHRWDCLGAYGNPDVQTPNIDTLAADGVRFENHFCPYPVCTPSRYSLLSGLYVHEHRGWTNHCTLHPDIATFPRLLRQAGYHTKAVGKMHFTPTYLDVGFDEMILCEQDGPGRWDDDYHRDLQKLGLVDRNDLEDQRAEYREHARPEYWDTCGALPSNLPEEHHSTTWIARHAMDALENWGDSGNLLMVGFVKPHHPFDPPAEWTEMYDPAKLSLRPGWLPACLPHDLALQRGYFPYVDLTETKLRQAMAFYYATISQIDFHVGRMIERLKQKGLYENTMIVFTSDHGEYLGFHHLLLKGNHVYDPLMRVPLIVKYPENQKSGTVRADLVSNLDVAPTILAQAGCVAAPEMQGYDLFTQEASREIVFAHSHEGRYAVARTHTRKLLQAPGQSLFYNLATDPLEQENLADLPAHQREIEDLAAAIRGWAGRWLPETYLDEQAPRIRQPNVPPVDGSHRADIIEYYQKKMAECVGHLMQ